MSLKPCPCGKVPTELVVVKSSYKWSTAVPNCCGEWMYEFRVDGATAKGPKQSFVINNNTHIELANAAWNNMPRGDNAQQEKTK